MPEKKTDHMERRVAAYLDRKTLQEFKNACGEMGGNSSKTIHFAVAQYYTKLPKQEQENLLSLWNEMTPEQRKNPKKL